MQQEEKLHFKPLMAVLIAVALVLIVVSTTLAG